MRLIFWPPLVALLQFIDRLNHHGQIHLVHFESLTDAVEKRDRKFPTQVLAELLQPIEDDQRVLRIHVQQFVREEVEAERFQKAKSPFRRHGVEAAKLAGINQISARCCDRLAVADPYSDNCSSLCADQWPKSSGRAEPNSNGSPEVAM